MHLLHEVLAYVADEADMLGQPAARCQVTVLADGSVSVRDYGGGTDTRRDTRGRPIRKPVIASKDLRSFDDPSVATLADGYPRRGMSVIAALSNWLIHENRRLDGAWRQRYESGVPVTDLSELQPDGTTGTLVHFLPMQGLTRLDRADLGALLQAAWPGIAVEYSEPN